MRWARRAAGSSVSATGRRYTSASSWASVKATSGCESASAWKLSSKWRYSVAGLRRKARRAGTLKNRLRTATLVPGGVAQGSGAPARLPSTRTRVPASSCIRRVRSSTWATAPMDASASPRKPSVRRQSRSDASRSLLVAWRVKLSTASARLMPAPSSVTCTSVEPAPSRRTSMRSAPASRLFSTSSLSAEAGRCTTSPAAILLASASGIRWIRRSVTGTAGGSRINAAAGPRLSPSDPHRSPAAPVQASAQRKIA